MKPLLSLAFHKFLVFSFAFTMLACINTTKVIKAPIIAGGAVTNAIGPTVINVTSSNSNSTYTTGQIITVTVQFSEVVNVTGTPRILLEMGETDRYATYITGSGSDTLNFIYTLQLGDTSSDLDYVATSSLELNGGTITNIALTSATLTLATPGAINSLGDNKNIIIATIPFITTWKTDNVGTSAANQITLPLVIAGTYNFIVDWGDNSQSTITAWNSVDTTHTYLAPGTYTVTMTGTFTHFIFAGIGDKLKILDITHWGNNHWATMADAFHGCSNLQITATDNPDLSGVTDMHRMFHSAILFNGNIGAWNTSTITNMQGMFVNNTSFNQNIGSWNTSSVTNMVGMFTNASAFNQNIGSWNTAAVTNLTNLFYGATAFNQNIRNWNTSSATAMDSMFYNATNFNQNIGIWNTSSVISMGNMFSGASNFNQDLSEWNVTSVTIHNSFDTNANLWVLARPLF